MIRQLIVLAGVIIGARDFALNSTDHHTHAWQTEMIGAYMRWRNARVQPKTNLAPTQLSAPGPVTRPTFRDEALDT